MLFFKRVGIACVFQLFFLYQIQAQNYTYNYTSGCVEAIKAISKLQLDKAKMLLTEEQKKQPNNVAIDYLNDCLEYYSLITSSDKESYKILEKNKSIRINRLQKISKKQAIASYAEAEILLHWSILKLMHNDYISGAIDLRSSYQLHEQNNIQYPQFSGTQKSLGFIKALLGTLPENYQWILNIVGLKGDYAKGLKLLEQYLTQKTILDEQILDRQQGNYYYVLLQLYFGDKQLAWTYTSAHTNDYADNMLSCYLRAFIASRTAHSDEAIAIINKKPKGSAFTKYEDIDYILGYVKLNKLDKEADIEFKKFVTFTKNKVLQKEAYERLAWSSLIQNDTLKYVTYRNIAFKISPTKDDEDLMVDKNLSKGKYPNIDVLKARLLFDGGYFAQSELIMKDIRTEKLTPPYQVAEYYYRYGRIMQEQKKYSKAIEYFGEAIKTGEPANSYFAPYSCLQLGRIYQNLGFKQTAEYYYRKTLSYKNYIDKGYIQQKVTQSLSEIN